MAKFKWESRFGLSVISTRTHPDWFGIKRPKKRQGKGGECLNTPIRSVPDRWREMAARIPATANSRRYSRWSSR